MHIATTLSLRWLGGVAAAALLVPAFAADAGAAGSPEAKYQKERAACLSGQTNQARETCLKEAGAALAEARKGRLDNGEAKPSLNANALERCKVVPAADRTACERMARGEGKVSGSVEGGGVIKELVTIVPGKPEPSTPTTTITTTPAAPAVPPSR